MELAKKLYRYVTNGSSSNEILNLYNLIKDKDTLAMLNAYFMEHFNKSPEEYISEKFTIDEVYAISSTMNYIREPSEKNLRSRKKFYDKIGYAEKPSEQ